MKKTKIYDFLSMANKPRKTTPRPSSIPEKANRILQGILIFLFIILARVWHLSVIEHDKKIEEAHQPRKKTIVEPATRATIRDRFNEPLAMNRITYQVGIHYAQIAEVPSITWEKDSTGKKVKHYKRREYIQSLSQMLAEKLGLNPKRVEDLIHSKAVFYVHSPYILKEEIPEDLYYHLNFIAKDWPGIFVQQAPKRIYPKGKTGSHLLGYVGAIQREEYESILTEIQSLETLLVDLENGKTEALPESIESPEQARARLKTLKRKAYAINDRVGKGGIEGKFEEELRGYKGKKCYWCDAKGYFLRELPGSQPALPGRRVLLSISNELQTYAEELLVKNETVRDKRIKKSDDLERITQPWIKGGAIVAMNPKSGEIYALASYPRFDPNDFVSSGNPITQQEKLDRIRMWFESEPYLERVWERQQPLKRETFNYVTNQIEEEHLWLTWDAYLDLTLPAQSQIRHALERIFTLQDALQIEESASVLIDLSQQSNAKLLLETLFLDERKQGPEHKEILAALQHSPDEARFHRTRLESFLRPISHPNDQLLALDLIRIHVDHLRFPDKLRDSLIGQTLRSYQDSQAAFSTIEDAVKEMARELFHESTFMKWREENEQVFLKAIRLQEAKEHRVSKPYIDLLDREERRQFQDYWNESRWDVLTAFLTGEKLNPSLFDTDYFLLWHQELKQGAHSNVPWWIAYHTLQSDLNRFQPSQAISYLQTFRRYQDLDRPLLGRYPSVRRENGEQLEKHLALSFYPIYGYGFARATAFRQAVPQGSVFKLVTAYAALLQRFEELGMDSPSLDLLNPLTIQDWAIAGKPGSIGNFADGSSIPRRYKGGTLTPSMNKQIGTIDVRGALEHTSNPYFALLASDHLSSPEDLNIAAHNLSFGHRTEIDLPGEYPGRLPQDLTENQTGLYSYAIGQHSLVCTPLQTAVMLSAIANGGQVLKPKMIHMVAGRELPYGDDPLISHQRFNFEDQLKSIGLNFPLFLASASEEDQMKVDHPPTIVRKEIPMPPCVRSMMLEGMKQVHNRILNSGLWSLYNIYDPDVTPIETLKRLGPSMVGKTGTAEIVYAPSPSRENPPENVNHIWYASLFGEREQPYISFTPELVVIVYLKHGGYGKDCAPLAAALAQKWQEIQAKNK